MGAVYKRECVSGGDALVFEVECYASDLGGGYFADWAGGSS